MQIKYEAAEHPNYTQVTPRSSGALVALLLLRSLPFFHNYICETGRDGNSSQCFSPPTVNAC